MSMRKLIVAIVAVCLLSTGFLMANGSQEAAPKAAEKIILKVGYENNPGEPVDVAAQKWAELAAERSNGRIELQLFPSSQLGSKVDLTEQMKMGSNVITITDGSFLMDFVPDIGILSGPFLGTTWDEYFTLTSSPWFDEQVAKLEKTGLTVLTANWAYGDRHIISKQAVRTPADLEGVKIRCPNNELFIKTINGMGATATPMPWGDAYPALAQGVIEGVENPIPVLYGSKMYESAKYLNLTGHIKLLAMWIGGADFFNGLPADMKQIIMETGDEAGLTLNASLDKSDKEAMEELKAAGVTIVDDVDVAAFQKAVRPVYDSFSQWSPGLYETVKANMK